uniref:Dopamine beta-monooxygenase n=1 Tax=Solanum tuberosum TaxID=4113 RepID=M1BTK4_SOLTU
MESNGVEVAMYLHENTRKLDIMVGAKLKEEEETGWLAWGLNPGPEARMIGTQALIGIKTKNDEKLLKDTYNITSYTKLGCQLLPSPIDLNISNFNFIYVSKLKYHVILATIILPMKYDLSRLNQVWQVGINIGAVGNKELKMHGKGLMNYDSSETINLRTGKGRGNRVHESSKIRQMLFFKFKPGDRDEFRMYRNMFHHVVGYSLLIVSCINILKGIQIMHLDYTYWKPAYLGIVSCLAFIFLVFEIVSWFKFVCDKFGFWILCAKCIPNEEANEKKGSREDGRVQPSDTPINN